MVQDVHGKSRISMAKAAFINYNPLFTSKLDVRKKLVRCYIWSIGLCSGVPRNFFRGGGGNKFS